MVFMMPSSNLVGSDATGLTKSAVQQRIIHAQQNPIFAPTPANFAQAHFFVGEPQLDMLCIEDCCVAQKMLDRACAVARMGSNVAAQQRRAKIYPFDRFKTHLQEFLT